MCVILTLWHETNTYFENKSRWGRIPIIAEENYDIHSEHKWDSENLM